MAWATSEPISAGQRDRLGPQGAKCERRDVCGRGEVSLIVWNNYQRECSVRQITRNKFLAAFGYPLQWRLFFPLNEH